MSESRSARASATSSRSATTCGRSRATTRRRSTSTVRLNTNESPFPPPAGWRDEFAAELARRSSGTATPIVRRPRCARRSPTGTASTPEQVFAANGSNEVLQTLLLTYAGPGRTVATFEPTYQLHAHIARITGARVVEGERAADFTLDLAEVAAAVVASPARRSRSCARRTTRPVWSSRPSDGATRCSTSSPGLRRRRRGLRPVRRLVGARPGRRRRAARRRAHVLEDVEHGGGPPRLPRRSVVAGRQLDKVVLPYHLDAAKQIAGRLALRHVDEMDERVQADRRRARAAQSRRWPRCPSTSFPSGANFVLFRAAIDARGRDVWQGLVDRGVLGPRLLGLAAARRTACASPIGTPDENDALPRRAAPEVARREPRPATRSRATKETSIEIAIDLDGTGVTDVLDRHPVLRPHARPARAPRRLRPDGRGHRRPRTSTPTTPSRTSRSRSARRSARRSATRPASAASPAGCSRSTRRWSRSPSTCPGRPFVAWDVELPESLPLGNPAFDPQLAEHAVSSFATNAGITLHVTLKRAAATCTTSSRRRSRASPAACATPCASTAAGGVPSTKGVL